MKNDKRKLLTRIIATMMVSIIVGCALAIPLGAVVNSSQGGFLDFNLTANSTFPLTVGFSYVTRDPATGAGNTYVYATEIGGFGEEWNTTLYGVDEYTQSYTPMEGVNYNLVGSLSYNLLEREFPENSYIMWDDGGVTSTIKRGYQVISLLNQAPSNGNILGQQQGAVLRARDVVYNPAWLVTEENQTSLTNEPMLPAFLSPIISENNSEAVVLTYSWSCTIIDQEGVVHEHSGYEVFDTREDNISSRYVTIIPIEVLMNYSTQKTIVIAEYSGFLDVDYYTYNGDWLETEASGDGYLLKLQYPLYDTSGVTITESETYREFMSVYGFPTFEKYIDTDGTIIMPSPPYKMDFTGWLGTAVGGFLDFELFEGFSLGGLLSVLIGFSFIMLFLKFFAGG